MCKSLVCIHISMGTWVLCVCACFYVCEEGTAERNEGHLWDLGSCKWRRLTESSWYCVLVFFFPQCVYVWRIPPQLDQFSLSLVDKHWSSRCPLLFSSPSLTFCLPVNGHPSDCQGISQAVIQLTLPYFSPVAWGSISFFPPLSVTCEMQRLVWNTVVTWLAVQASYTFSVLTLIRSQDGQVTLHFLALM